MPSTSALIMSKRTLSYALLTLSTLPMKPEIELRLNVEIHIIPNSSIVRAFVALRGHISFLKDCGAAKLPTFAYRKGTPSSLRSAMTTDAPSTAKRMAVPTDPLAASVITATLLSSLPMVDLFFGRFDQT